MTKNKKVWKVIKKVLYTLWCVCLLFLLTLLLIGKLELFPKICFFVSSTLMAVFLIRFKLRIDKQYKEFESRFEALTYFHKTRYCMLLSNDKYEIDFMSSFIVWLSRKLIQSGEKLLQSRYLGRKKKEQIQNKLAKIHEMKENY